jgi:rRNA-processing protein FCF1
MRRPVLLDTNILILPFQRKLDVMGELERLFEGEPYQPVVLAQCLEELERISLGLSPDARAARSALTYVKRLSVDGRVHFERTARKDVDEALREYALARSAVVATNDYKLKREPRAKGVRVVTARGDRLVFA